MTTIISILEVWFRMFVCPKGCAGERDRTQGSASPPDVDRGGPYPETSADGEVKRPTYHTDETTTAHQPTQPKAHTTSRHRGTGGCKTPPPKRGKAATKGSGILPGEYRPG